MFRPGFFFFFLTLTSHVSVCVHAYFLQPLVFGAMIHRDEAFEAIISQYTKIIGATPPVTVTNPET